MCHLKVEPVPSQPPYMLSPLSAVLDGDSAVMSLFFHVNDMLNDNPAVITHGLNGEVQLLGEVPWRGE